MADNPVFYWNLRSREKTNRDWARDSISKLSGGGAQASGKTHRIPARQKSEEKRYVEQKYPSETSTTGSRNRTHASPKLLDGSRLSSGETGIPDARGLRPADGDLLRRNAI